MSLHQPSFTSHLRSKLATSVQSNCYCLHSRRPANSRTIQPNDPSKSERKREDADQAQT
ncbi:uncharacterized protein BDW47DRAFT_12599 [Aspergillus candidus]|uniref:Uncharacterized protein n=1 Tax=Aspergillus candidus TaxID=41067 RepID=A0A2I2FFN6_ASPCN|nr:hypothetical protein BDW47DRAFT_12599 [Aspergillus candidus]PLB39425.1 hypothetical protein BDW47DRAFT_12599 [Aspergillus candidus]